MKLQIERPYIEAMRTRGAQLATLQQAFDGQGIRFGPAESRRRIWQ